MSVPTAMPPAQQHIDPTLTQAKVNPPPAPSMFTPYVDAFYSAHRPITQPIANTYSKFENWKEGFGLTQHGTVENLTREVKRE